eukprot:1077625-Amphidinium_carterae.1
MDRHTSLSTGLPLRANSEFTTQSTSKSKEYTSDRVYTERRNYKRSSRTLDDTDSCNLPLYHKDKVRKLLKEANFKGNDIENIHN